MNYFVEELFLAWQAPNKLHSSDMYKSTADGLGSKLHDFINIWSLF